MKNKIFYLIIIFITALFSNSCLHLQETLASKENNIKTTLRIMADKNGKEIAEITSNLMPSCTFIGDIKKDESGDLVILLTKLYTITTSERSYTEAEFSLYGELKLIPTNNGYSIETKNKPEVIDIIKGEMRVVDTYYRNKEGASRVQNKFERLKETAMMLRTIEGFEIPALQGGKNYFFTESRDEPESFTSHAKRILLPELYGFSILQKKNLLHKDFSHNPLETKDDTLADGIIYNADYNNKIIPKSLQEVRTSGTMLRDYNESKELLMALYNFDYFFEGYINAIEISKKK